MTASHRPHELIQKYLDAVATEEELTELEELLAADPEVATAFAGAARLHAGLQEYFKKQYKIGEVAALLEAPAAPVAPVTGQPEGRVVEPTQSGAPLDVAMPAGSAYVPIFARLEKAQRSRHATRPASPSRHWRAIAALALLVMLGVTLWSLRRPAVERARLISGRVAVADREVTRLPEKQTFEVAGKQAAVIELPGGARIELAPQTRAALRRENDRLVVQLESGRGEFHVSPAQAALRVETPLGVVTAADSRFSLELFTKLPGEFIPTIPVTVPSLVVAVVQGAVTVEHGDVSTMLSAGQEHVFL
jgi:ferric-dicitrate binding protein FerR (iron transport regulator)